MDEYLAQIAAAAEDGREFPRIRVVSGNTLFVGTLGSSKSFSDDVGRALAEEIYNSQRPNRKQADAVFHDSVGKAAEIVRPISSSVSGDGGPVLTLRQCEVWPASGGDGLSISLARVPVASVDGWWFGAGQQLKAPAAGGGWMVGFGVVVPSDS